MLEGSISPFIARTSSVPFPITGLHTPALHRSGLRTARQTDATSTVRIHSLRLRLFIFEVFYISRGVELGKKHHCGWMISGLVLKYEGYKFSMAKKLRSLSKSGKAV